MTRLFLLAVVAVCAALASAQDIQIAVPVSLLNDATQPLLKQVTEWLDTNVTFNDCCYANFSSPGSGINLYVTDLDLFNVSGTIDIESSSGVASAIETGEWHFSGNYNLCLMNGASCSAIAGCSGDFTADLHDSINSGAITVAAGTDGHLGIALSTSEPLSVDVGFDSTLCGKLNDSIGQELSKFLTGWGQGVLATAIVGLDSDLLPISIPIPPLGDFTVGAAKGTTATSTHIVFDGSVSASANGSVSPASKPTSFPSIKDDGRVYARVGASSLNTGLWAAIQGQLLNISEAGFKIDVQSMVLSMTPGVVKTTLSAKVSTGTVDLDVSFTGGASVSVAIANSTYNATIKLVSGSIKSVGKCDSACSQTISMINKGLSAFVKQGKAVNEAGALPPAIAAAGIEDVSVSIGSGYVELSFGWDLEIPSLGLKKYTPACPTGSEWGTPIKCPASL